MWHSAAYILLSIRKVVRKATHRKRLRSIPMTDFSNPERVLPKERIGLFELSKDNSGTSIDIVAVHGLQGDAFKTWEHENGSNWLRDFLPEDVPSARIMTFGYESTVAFSKSVAKIEDKSLELLNSLSSKRDEPDTTSIGSSRPIIFICHSLGGILVKKALILAHENLSDKYYKDIVDNTKAIIFLGVPHKGSGSAWWGNFAANALKAASIGRATNTALVADLRRDSETLTNISKQFVHRGRDLKIYSFYETQKLGGVVVVSIEHSLILCMTRITDFAYLQVVDEISARIGVPNEKVFAVDATHRSICRIPAKESQRYKDVGFWTAKLANTVLSENVSFSEDFS